MIADSNPCGYPICPAAIRIVWSPEFTKRQAAAWLGVVGATATRWAGLAGLDPRVNARPAKQISARSAREAWMDRTINTSEAAVKLGLSVQSLYKRSIKMGLPPRKSGVVPKPWPEDFNAMWAAGITTRDMAVICNRASCSHITIEAKRRKLPGRKIGSNSKPTSPAQYQDIKLRAAMAATAAIERSHWEKSGMVDGRIYERKAA